MRAFVRDLLEQTVTAAIRAESLHIGLLGSTSHALELRQALMQQGWGERIIGIFDPGISNPVLPGGRPWHDLASEDCDLLVICADDSKEDLLRAYVALAAKPDRIPDVVMAGMGHLDYRNPVFDELNAPAMVPSYANGHPHTRIHLFQCLEAAANAGIEGAVIELGAFKGGTTAWLALAVKRLGLNCRVMAFDSWAGFPSRRSVLDLYANPRCVFSDVDSVRMYLAPLGVELIQGDIAETAPKALRGVPVLLAFVDTDNYSGAYAALETIVPNLVSGGMLVFDHYWTSSDYIYTIGERMAASDVLHRSGLLQLHGTGVFVKLR